MSYYTGKENANLKNQVFSGSIMIIEKEKNSPKNYITGIISNNRLTCVNY